MESYRTGDKESERWKSRGIQGKKTDTITCAQQPNRSQTSGTAEKNSESYSDRQTDIQIDRSKVNGN